MYPVMGPTFGPFPIHAPGTSSPIVAAGDRLDLPSPGSTGPVAAGYLEWGFWGAEMQVHPHASSDLEAVSPRAVVGVPEQPGPSCVPHGL